MTTESFITGNKHSYRNWKYFFILIPVCLVIYGNLTGGWFTLANFIFSFIILGMAEIILAEDRSNDDITDDRLPDLLLGLAVIAQALSIFSLIYGIHTGSIRGYWIFAASLSTGTSSGTLAIVVAHELIHRKAKFWNLAGRFLLFTVFNPYFYIHHLRIHHKYVGTSSDPVTARIGESYYHYVVRSISQQVRQAFALEKKRCVKNGDSVFGFHNYVALSVTGYLVVILFCIYFFGIWVALALINQALIANLLLEYTNYIEHYGLSREDNERVNETHSWQSDKVISRFFLIDLSRHADHHFHASKPFNELLSHEKSPVLPGGYASLFLPVLIPPLWFRLVNKRIPV